MGELHADGDSLAHGWVINPALEGRRAKSGSVQCLHSADITKDGVKDILVGREDGLVEVWSFDVGDAPKLAFERSLHESITSIACGAVSSASFDEVVVATYSGQIVAFSSEPAAGFETAETGATEPAAGGGAGGGGGGRSKEKSGKRMAKLMAEIDALSAQVAKERERHARGAQGEVGATELKLKDKWTLSPDEACYKLSLELALPLEGVLLQCDVPVEMVDHEANGAIASRSPAPDGRPGVLISYRCQEVTNRLELRMRTAEGRYGQLQAFVWPRISPKTCVVSTHSIKPMSCLLYTSPSPRD